MISNSSLHRLVLLQILWIQLLTSGCSTHTYDYSPLLHNQPRSILVLPPFNNTSEIGAEYIFLSTISKPLAEKGYYVFPVSVLNQFLQQHGLSTTKELNTVPLEKIRTLTGADAILHVTLKDWGHKYQLISSKSIVHAQLNLIDTRTGDLLWQTAAYAEESSDEGHQGLAGAVANSVAEQISSTSLDHTRELSITATNNAINNQDHGLLEGPYRRSLRAQ